jgi:Putative zinc dependent peptidase (DUF5700)
MKKLILIFVVSMAIAPLKAQIIDDSTLPKYFEITESLRQGNKLDSAVWQSFLNLKGNQLYLKNQNSGAKYWNDYRKAMEIVYLPQKDSILKAQLKDPSKYWLTYMVNQYKKNEAALKQYHKAIMDNKNAYLDAAYAECFKVLPKKLQKRNPNVTIHLTAINNDAVAEGGNNIIFTLWCAYNFDKEKNGALVGHELHHVVRVPQKYAIYKTDTALLQILELILTEGVPDLIDKKLTMSPNFTEELKYGEFLLESGKETLANLDSLIMAAARGAKQVTEKDINNVAPMSGHVPGFYMSDIIERNGLKKQIIKNVLNPFQFFYIYNEAAKKDKAKPYVLSDQTMAYLKAVEKRNKAIK